jgi:hypothetical protein
LAEAARARGERIPIPVTVAILAGALEGLHAAHEARSETGEPLGIVHRDVSPQNIVVGSDGLARVLDFGVAKAAGRLQSTRDGQLKGKLAYMPPEQLRHEPLGRQGDVYAASVVLWEALTGERLFGGDDEGAIITGVLLGKVEPPSRALARGRPPLRDEDAELLERLDPVVLRGLDRDPGKRFASAGEMAVALERCATPASAREVGEWVERVAGRVLAERAARVAEIESGRVAADVLSVEPAAYVDDARAQLESAANVATKLDATPPAPATRSPLLVFSAVTVVVLVGAIVVLLVRAHDAALSSQTRTTPEPSADSASGPAAPVASSRPTVEAPSASATLVTPIGAVPSSAKPTPPAGSRRPKASSADCAPPFFWDAMGKKHYKAQCL